MRINTVKKILITIFLGISLPGFLYAEDSKLFYTNSNIPLIYPRSTWDNSPSLNTLLTWYPNASSTAPDYQPIERMIIHDTATPNNDPYTTIARIQSIYRYHAVTRGWGDIGYNYLIDQNGKIYEGKYGGNGIRGAHTYYDKVADNYNLGSIGIAIIGSFENQDAPEIVYNSLERLLGWLSATNNIDPTQMKKSSMIWNTTKQGYTTSYTGPTIAGHADVEPSNPDPGVVNLAKVREEAKKYFDQFTNYIYKAPNSEKIYTITNGVRTDYNTLIDFSAKNLTYNKLAEINQTQLDLFSSSHEQKYANGSFLRDEKNPNVYLIENGERRVFSVTGKQFIALGFDWSQVRIVTNDDLKLFATGTPIKYAQDNSLLRDSSTGTVYSASNGKLRRFTSASLFNTLGYKWNKINDLTKGDIDQYIQSDIMTYPNGTLAKLNSSNIYLLNNGVKRLFLSEDFLKILGYNTSKITTVNKEELDQYVDGQFMSLANGSLVKSLDNNTVYLIEDGTKKPIASSEVFKTLGYKWTDIITLGAQEVTTYKDGGLAKFPNGTLFRKDGDPKVYVAKDNDKVWIPSIQSAKQQGYNLAKTLILSASIFNTLYGPTAVLAQEIAPTTDKSNEKPPTIPTPPAQSNQLIKIAIYSPSAQESIKVTANGPYNYCNLSDICQQRNALEISEIPFSTNAYAKMYGLSSDTIMQLLSYNDIPVWNVKLNYNKFRGSIEIKYSPVTNKLWVINELPLEDYLRGIGEALNADAYEYQKAFSIITRSYATFHLQHDGKYGPNEIFHLKNGSSDQVYKGYTFETIAPNLVKTVEEMKGKVMTFQGAVARALYSSDSGGTTKNSCIIFGDYFCNTKYDYLRGGISDPTGTIHVASKISASHGVGMSAIGARKLAELGKTAEEIIKYYYVGVEIEQR